MGHSHSSNSPQRDLIPYLYTGKYQTSLTGLIDMDAGWYNLQVDRFIQPDYYNFAQLALPNGARNRLLATTSLNTQMLLNDPSQQMRYGYVSGNPMRWVDPMGLVEIQGSGHEWNRGSARDNVANVISGGASEIDVFVAQVDLLVAGYDLGSYGADGDWGSRSNRAGSALLLEPAVIAASNESGVPTGLIMAHIHAESNFDTNAVSPVGAVGLMQFMPATGVDVGLMPYNGSGGFRDLRANANQNIAAGGTYLNYLYGRMDEEGSTYLDDRMLASASYNAGPGSINNRIQREYGDYLNRTGTVIYEEIASSMPSETQGYINKIYGPADKITGQRDGGLNAYYQSIINCN